MLVILYTVFLIYYKVLCIRYCYVKCIDNAVFKIITHNRKPFLHVIYLFIRIYKIIITGGKVLY